MTILFEPSQLGSVVGALYYLGTAILISAALRAIFNK